LQRAGLIGKGGCKNRPLLTIPGTMARLKQRLGQN
jgi:hypothetical protein